MVASDPDGAYIADRVLAMMRLESAAARTASPPLHSRTQARLRLTINRGEYFVPFLLLLRAISPRPISENEVHHMVTSVN